MVLTTLIILAILSGIGLIAVYFIEKGEKKKPRITPIDPSVKTSLTSYPVDYKVPEPKSSSVLSNPDNKPSVKPSLGPSLPAYNPKNKYKGTKKDKSKKAVTDKGVNRFRDDNSDDYFPINTFSTPLELDRTNDSNWINSTDSSDFKFGGGNFGGSGAGSDYDVDKSTSSYSDHSSHSSSSYDSSSSSDLSLSDSGSSDSGSSDGGSSSD